MNLVRTFLDSLPRMFVACYRHKRWVWHIVAAAITAVCVFSGLDWWFFEQTRQGFLQPLIWTAGIGGFFVPVVLALALYWGGEWRRNNKLMHLGALVGQAEILAISITSFYKVFTGRIQPEFLTHYGTTDISKEFLFGFFRHGIYDGWPSSHAALAVSAATVIFLSCKDWKARGLALVWAAIVSVGAAVGFHWFSDVVAGIIIGISIGTTVYTFRK